MSAGGDRLPTSDGFRAAVSGARWRREWRVLPGSASPFAEGASRSHGPKKNRRALIFRLPSRAVRAKYWPVGTGWPGPEIG